MREYETVFITQPNLPESQLKQMVERMGSLIERHSGRLFYARNMGRKTLAYPIRKQTKGIYTCLDYAAAGDAVKELERSMRLDENVLRFLTVVKREEVDIEARAAEIAARGEDLPAQHQAEEAEEKAHAAESDGPAVKGEEE